jgi:serine/threonine protein kinase
MNESLVYPEELTTTQADLHWQDRLDALVSGHCTEDDFVEEITNLRDASPSSTWDIVALLDQRYRRGQMPADLFRSLESKLAQHELDTADDGMTADLPPSLVDSAAATPRVAALSSVDRKVSPEAAPAMQVAPAVSAAPSASVEPSVSAASSVSAAAPEPPLGAPSVLRPETRIPMQTMEIGRVLRDRYVLESRLGSGGMGTVFKASDRFRSDLPEGDRHVAIKILHEQIHSRPEVLSRLRREFYCAQTLSHKNIVRVYELDRDDDVAFFTMELLEGKSLSAMMKQFHPLPVTRQYAWPIIRDIGAGLAHAHARKVVHADLKPQNILITNSGEVRILDFGTSSTPACQAGAERPAKAGSTAFTPAYASCELLNGQPADPRDDLYALACLSYELLAGEHPFQNKRSTEARSLGMTPRRPPGLTSRQWRALSMGLAWERKDRSISVRDWIAELNPRFSLLGLLARSRDVSLERPQRPRKLAAKYAIPLLGALLILLVTWTAVKWPSKGPIERNDTAALGTVAQAPAHVDAPPKAAPASAAAPASTAAPVTAEHRIQDAVPAIDAVQSKEPLAAAARKGLGREGPRAVAHGQTVNSIEIRARTYYIRRGQNFVEVRVRRSFGFDDDATFEWWTESSSAQAGLDYMPQIRTVQAFPRGRRGASVFVKVMANPARKSARVFFVVIGNLSKGNSLGAISRTAIQLPPAPPAP